MFKITHFITRNNVKEVVNESDKPFDWFPELEKFCTHNFNVKELVFNLDLDKMDDDYTISIDENIQEISFKIEKVIE